MLLIDIQTFPLCSRFQLHWEIIRQRERKTQRKPSSWPVLNRARLTSRVPDYLCDVLGFAPGALVREQRQAVDVCRRCCWIQCKQCAANLNPLPHDCTYTGIKPQQVTALLNLFKKKLRSSDKVSSNLLISATHIPSDLTVNVIFELCIWCQCKMTTLCWLSLWNPEIHVQHVLSSCQVWLIWIIKRVYFLNLHLERRENIQRLWGP